MIENLRKYPGVIIAALVAVFIGFLLMDSQQYFRNGGGGSKVITVDNVSYDESEFNKLGPASRALTQQLSSYQAMTMYEFSMAMADNKAASEDAFEKSFFTRRILLQLAGKEFGIEPSVEEIQTFIRERSVFAETDPTDPTKKSFNKEGYEGFILNRLGKSGMSEKDVYQLVKDVLTYEKLSELLASGISVDQDKVKALYQANRQKIGISYANLKLEEFSKKLAPTEEELKKYWEERKDSYKTENRRKFSYVVGTPKYPAGAEKAPTPPTAEPGKPAPEPSEADKKITEQRKKAELEVAAQMDDLFTHLDESKGGTFEEEVKSLGWELKVTDLFSSTTLPEELMKLTPRKTDKTIEQLLFSLKVTSDPLSKFTNYLAIGEQDWFVARLDAEEESRVKTYEEAKDEVRKQWLEEKGREEMKKAADEAHKKIKEALAAKKSFADAAKEAGLSAITIDPFGNGENPAGHPDAQALFTAAQYTTPGELTEVVTTTDGSAIAVVDKREIVKDPNFDSMLSGGVDQTKRSIRIQAFQAWINERYELAKIQ
jgi:hypothetical protein